MGWPCKVSMAICKPQAYLMPHRGMRGLIGAYQRSVGTLTKNEMTVVAMRSAGSKWTVSGVGYEPTGTFSIK